MISEGWKRTKPRSSQRCAPMAMSPVNMTASSRTRPKQVGPRRSAADHARRNLRQHDHRQQVRGAKRTSCASSTPRLRPDALNSTMRADGADQAQRHEQRAVEVQRQQQARRAGQRALRARGIERVVGHAVQLIPCRSGSRPAALACASLPAPRVVRASAGRHRGCVARSAPRTQSRRPARSRRRPRPRSSALRPARRRRTARGRAECSASSPALRMRSFAATVNTCAVPLLPAILYSAACGSAACRAVRRVRDVEHAADRDIPGTRIARLRGRQARWRQLA